MRVKRHVDAGVIRKSFELVDLLKGSEPSGVPWQHFEDHFHGPKWLPLTAARSSGFG